MIVMMDIQLMNACSNTCWFCPPYAKDCKDKVEHINIDKLLEFITYGINNKYIADNATVCVNRYYDPLLNLDNNIEFLRKLNKYHKNLDIHSAVPSNHLLKMDTNKLREFVNELNCLRINIYKHMFEPNDFNTHIKQVVNHMLPVYNTKKFNINRTGAEISTIIIKAEDESGGRTNIAIDQEANLKRTNTLKNRAGSVEELVDASCKRENICKVSKLHFGVDSNGNVMPCCEMYSRTNKHSPYKVGNIYIDDYEDLYQTIMTKDYLEEEPCTHCTFEGNWILCKLK